MDGGRGRNIQREGVRAISVRSKQKPSPSSIWRSVCRSMLAPQNLSRGRDYRTHYSAGHPGACRSPTWELQVTRAEGGHGGTAEMYRKCI